MMMMRLRVLYVLVAAGLNIVHVNGASFDGKSASFYDENTSRLVPTENQTAIASLSDLDDGVYSIQLSVERGGSCSGPEAGPGE